MDATKLSNIERHICLGIKKQNEDDFFDIIHISKPASKYIDITEDNAIELVPILSKRGTNTSECVLVTPGDELKFDDISVPLGEVNFGSVYRINVMHKGEWLEDQDSDINSVINKRNGFWWNWGRICVGTVVDKNGQILENQLVAVNCNNWLASSFNGAHWADAGSLGVICDGWNIGAAYGNGVWCVINCASDGITGKGTMRSIDGGQNWQKSSSLEALCLMFGEGVFMSIDGSGAVYTSPDAETWTQIGEIKNSTSEVHTLIYGDGKWICGTADGYVYQLKDGKGIWEQCSADLYKINSSSSGKNGWYGGCYAKGYFYAVHYSGIVARSFDGIHWEKMTEFSTSNYCNITYYKDKLWIFRNDGYKYCVGLI